MNQFAEDLLWVVNSPSLIVPGATHSPISPAQIDRPRLTSFMNEGLSKKVGPYFERLILYWLIHIRSVEIVAHGEQVRVDGRTLGEMDFLFVDELGRLTHWEVAVKFYLYLPDEPLRGSRFVGPNSSDSFERKTTRLYEHQLALSKKVRDDVVVREALMKGCLFYPPGIHSVREFPRWMSANHERGFWVRRRDLEKLAHPSEENRILRKPYWLSAYPANGEHASAMDWNDFVSEVDRQMAQYQRPVFAARCENSLGAAETTAPSFSRFFIVPDDWPGE
ncbi:DUF1853 family protein [Rhodopirellula bahusiensis]|uniref:DUF1853 family protein n=1 Tax=Rhodopirellula bahusiensis TaxID=2014065 RepID=UPI003262E8E1